MIRYFDVLTVDNKTVRLVWVLRTKIEDASTGGRTILAVANGCCPARRALTNREGLGLDDARRS
jgi:hypothetical protein